MYLKNNGSTDSNYCLIKIKEKFKERKIKFYNEEEEELLDINYEEIHIENDRQFIYRIYIFPKNFKKNQFQIEIIKNKKYKITPIYTNNFIFENIPGINISDYYKFLIYQQFIKKYPEFSQLEKMLYDDCYNLCIKKSEIDFILLLEILCYYKGDNQKTDTLLKGINSSSFSYINSKDLDNNKDKYLNYVQTIYNKKKSNIEKNSSEENMKLLIKFYLDFFYSIENFRASYKQYEKKKKFFEYNLFYDKQK